MENHPAVLAYRAVEHKRLCILAKYQGADSDEEDAALDEADAAWWALSEEEMEHIRKTPGPHHEATLQWLEKAGV